MPFIVRVTRWLFCFQALYCHPHRKEAGTGQKQKVCPHVLVFILWQNETKMEASSGTSAHILLLRTMPIASPATNLQVWQNGMTVPLTNSPIKRSHVYFDM